MFIPVSANASSPASTPSVHTALAMAETLRSNPNSTLSLYEQRINRRFVQTLKQLREIQAARSLAGIPPQAFEYKLGSKSALDWIIDQYQIKCESDPNRDDDPGYIVRLIGQVTRVSVETMRIVNSLPNFLVQSNM